MGGDAMDDIDERPNQNASGRYSQKQYNREHYITTQKTTKQLPYGNNNMPTEAFPNRSTKQSKTKQTEQPNMLGYYIVCMIVRFLVVCYVNILCLKSCSLASILFNFHHYFPFS